MTPKKNKGKDSQKTSRLKRGFVPDFSCYLERYYPLDDAYEEPRLIERLGNIIRDLLFESQPIADLTGKGWCKKLEKMTPSKDKEFFKRCSTIEEITVLSLYYASFGNNGQGIVIGFDFSVRKAYILAIDRKHSIRRYHGKFG